MKEYRPDVDGLRAVAVICVVLFHFFPELLSGGFVGVDVFFVISGYLIAGLSLWQGHFIVRRINRILPALLVTLFAVMGVGFLILYPAEYAGLAWHSLSSALYFENLTLISESGYFDSEIALKPLMHMWSLSIEWQFYIIFSVLCVLGFSVGKNKLFMVIFLLSFLYSIYDQSAGYFSITSRVWEFCAGMLISVVHFKWADLGHSEKGFLSCVSSTWHAQRWLPMSAFAPSVLGISGIVLIICTSYFYSESTEFPGVAAILPVLGAGLVISTRSGLVNTVISSRFFVYAGKISYPLYLWHWPVYSYLYLFDPSVFLLISGVLLSIFLSIVTYHFVERPLSKLRESYLLSGVLVVMSGLISCVSYFVYVSGGWAERAEFKKLPELDGGTEMISYIGERYPLCSSDELRQAAVSYGEILRCRQSTTDAAKIQFIGDSHAEHYFVGFAEQLPNEVTVGHTIFGCVPFLNWPGKDCIKAAQTLHAIAVDENIQVVILAAFWSYRLERAELDPNIANLDASKKAYVDAAFKASLAETLNFLIANGKEVIFFHDVPTLSKNPAQCLSRTILPGIETDNNCDVDLATAEKVQARYRKLVGKVLSEMPSVRVVDPWSVMCDDVSCGSVADGEFLYTDISHLSIHGSRWLAKKFFTNDVLIY